MFPNESAPKSRSIARNETRARPLIHRPRDRRYIIVVM
jgi:hypothetical protein